MSKNGPHWTGVARLIRDKLEEPLRWKKPRRVFVNSMSDLFHESLVNEEIAAVFGVMAATPRHTYQILTKRAARMLDWFRWATNARINDATREALGRDDFAALPTQRHGMVCTDWPLSNVWLGVSVEDQQRADERIPYLLAMPAVVRFVSAEPLLEEIDLRVFLTCKTPISWCIVGGESGPGSRPFDLAWARSLLAQCREADVRAFFKQAGRVVVDSEWLAGTYAPEDKRTLTAVSALGLADGATAPNLVLLKDAKGGNLAELPGEFHVREFPRSA